MSQALAALRQQHADELAGQEARWDTVQAALAEQRRFFAEMINQGEAVRVTSPTRLQWTVRRLRARSVTGVHEGAYDMRRCAAAQELARKEQARRCGAHAPCLATLVPLPRMTAKCTCRWPLAEAHV